MKGWQVGVCALMAVVACRKPELDPALAGSSVHPQVAKDVAQFLKDRHDRVYPDNPSLGVASIQVVDPRTDRTVELWTLQRKDGSLKRYRLVFMPWPDRLQWTYESLPD